MSCSVKAKGNGKELYPPWSRIDTWHISCRGASPIPIIIVGGGITFAGGTGPLVYFTGMAFAYMHNLSLRYY